MTVALCTSACKSGGYTYAGVEYSGECYCGNSITAPGAPATDGCNMLCNGNQTEYCGGPNRLDLYKAGAAAATTTAAATTAAGTTAAPTSAATGLPAGWTYNACWIDNANGGRILTNQQPDNAQTTVETCVAACKAAGYTIAGIEYSTQCFCGNQIINGGTKATSEADCNMACGGNANEKCGGPNRMSIYATGTVTVLAPPKAQTTGLPTGWTYSGCITEGTNNRRALQYQLILPQTNSAANCLIQCSTYGYTGGGMEYGEECYCGDAGDPATNGATAAPAADCSTACPGDPRYLCGAGNRLSFYTYSGTNATTWSYASGANAGQYKFLIGGVVVPLMLQHGINGKITFVEKFGTGPPNSTGAYELDLSQVNNFNAAWRTMHVKTDVFCSAGLVLPDKNGRQMTIGGWSGTSTFGIRLYSPSGSPGTPGTTDWQENPDELQLQNGRWYPSAMTMANGSILIVGGEEGSNGAPIPTVEVLPKVGPTVTMDWLQQTDPYNLYPFLTPLPGGGIFVQYYKSARILDATTFATTKILPDAPGAVNNQVSGRTYPFEGTGVLLPQKAPYSDPLSFMACGGSNPGPAIALDNCVTIQPEAANPQWVLERMPSKRVMPCVVALPDGTYIIMNGAHQGTAGFGLATDPNLNAVLYDPTLPVNARMTVLANTTVARLYHSEALLLQDGSIIVSGSDPEDGVNPQEYRIEQFLPPYLLSGKPRPAYTITDTDWAYGTTHTITITAGAPDKISLMAAVSSTHGNSMGMRTIFPAYTCNGGSCTITAPPNANISPPGWHQLFILQNGMPSLSKWVRIGGDPGKLGNWPNYADFTKPGL